MAFQIHGRTNFNILHGDFGGVLPINPALPQILFDALKAAWTSSLLDTFMAQSTTLAYVQMTDLSQASQPPFTSSGTGVVGTSASLPLADATSLVVTARTNKTGRSHRGRIYTFGYAANAMDSAGLAVSGASAAVLSFWNSAKATMASNGIPMAIRSPALPSRPSKPGGTLDPKPYELTLVTTLEVRDLIWDTNRRRTDTLRR